MVRYPAGGNKRGNDLDVRDGDVVYAIRRLSDGAIKFGKTQSLLARFNSMRQQHRDVEIIATTPGYTELEQRILVELDDYRIALTHFRLRTGTRPYKTPRKTEWCYPVPAVMQWIEVNMTSYNPADSDQLAFTTNTPPVSTQEKLA